MNSHFHLDNSFPHLAAAYLISILGGAMAVGLAFTVMFLPTTLEMLVLAPLVHEMAKPVGVLWVLERSPLWFHRRWHIVAACLLAGVVFALLESLAWVGVKHIEGFTAAHLLSWRCAATMVVQVLAVGILSIGLAVTYRPGHKHGLVEVPRLVPYYAGAVALHAAVNVGLQFMVTLKIFDQNYL